MASSTVNASPPPPPPKSPPQQQQQKQQQQPPPPPPPHPEVVDSINPPKYSKPEPPVPIFRSNKHAFTLLVIALLVGIPSALILYQDIMQSRKKNLQEAEAVLEKMKHEEEEERQDRKELASELRNQNQPITSSLLQLKSILQHQTQEGKKEEEEKGEENAVHDQVVENADQQQNDDAMLVRQQTAQETIESTTDTAALQTDGNENSSVREFNDDSSQIGDNKNQHSLVAVNSSEEIIDQLQQLTAALQDHDLLQHEIQLPEAPKLPDLEAIVDEVLPEPAAPSQPVVTDTTTVAEKQERMPVVDANEALQILRELYQLKFHELQQQNEKYVQLMRETLMNEFSAERNRLLKIIDDREQLYQQNLQNALDLKDRQSAETLQAELDNLRHVKQVEMENTLKEREQQMLSRFNEEKRQINEFIETLSERVNSLEHGWNDEIPNYLDQAKQAAQLASAIMELSDIVESRNTGYTSFQPEFDTVRRLGHGDQVVEAITEALLSTDPSLPSVGVPSHHQLEQRFNIMRKYVLRSEYTPHDSGMLGRALGIVLASLSVPEIGIVDGESTDARMARARHFMKTQRLEDAINEVEKLPKSQGDIAKDWLCDAHRRLSVIQAVQVLKLHTGSAFHDQQQQQQFHHQ